MIKLIALLLTITSANAINFPFLLPDEGSRFNYHLQTLIKNSHNQIVIVTPSMNYPSLTKSIIHSLSHGVNLKLIITKTSDDPLRLIAYQGVDLYHYTPRAISDTLILIDNTYVCHISGALNEKILSSTISNAWCSDEPTLTLKTQETVSRLLQRSSTYLQ